MSWFTIWGKRGVTYKRRLNTGSIKDSPGCLSAIYIQTDGEHDVAVSLYNNTEAVGDDVVWSGDVLGAQKQLFIAFPIPVLFSIGLFALVTGDGSEELICYYT